MTDPQPGSYISRRRRGRLVLGGLVVLVAAGVGGYYLLRPAPPPVPQIDLGGADPEVAAAVTAAVNAVRASPRDGNAWGRLGMILRAHDFDMQSVEAFRAAERYDTDNPRWPYLQGLTLVLFDPKSGLTCLERAAARAAPDQPEPHLRYAEALLDLGRVDDAEAAAAPVLRQRLSDARSGLIVARIAAERGDWAGVIAQTELLRDDLTTRRRVALLRAAAFRRLGQNAEADHEAGRAAELPEDAAWNDRFVQEVLDLQVGSDVEFRRGAALLKAGRPAEAIPVLERAAARSRNPALARLLLGQALNQAGQPAAAERVLNEAIRAEPGSVEGWFHLGVAQLIKEDYAAAANSFERVVQLKPDHALGYFNLGFARRKLGDRKAAAAAYEAALRCRPDHQPSREALEELRK